MIWPSGVVYIIFQLIVFSLFIKILWRFIEYWPHLIKIDKLKKNPTFQMIYNSNYIIIWNEKKIKYMSYSIFLWQNFATCENTIVVWRIFTVFNHQIWNNYQYLMVHTPLDHQKDVLHLSPSLTIPHHFGMPHAPPPITFIHTSPPLKILAITNNNVSFNLYIVHSYVNLHLYIIFIKKVSFYMGLV